jgi:hypothetical protein
MSVRTFSTLINDERVYVEHEGVKITAIKIGGILQLEANFCKDDLDYIRRRVAERVSKEQQQKKLH